METKSKTSLADTEAKLVDNISKLPCWARPIVLKYLGLYRQAVNKVQSLEPETLNECLVESKHLVEQMVEEIKQEAIRHGYPFAERKGDRMIAGSTSVPSDARKKQLKN